MRVGRRVFRQRDRRRGSTHNQGPLRVSEPVRPDKVRDRRREAGARPPRAATASDAGQIVARTRPAVAAAMSRISSVSTFPSPPLAIQIAWGDDNQ